MTHAAKLLCASLLPTLLIASTEWHSAYGEDRVIVDLLGRDGYFVDVGAGDPSNTRALERDFGWHGICIDANVEALHKLTRTRTCTVVGAVVHASAESVGLLVLPTSQHRDHEHVVARLVRNRSIAEARKEEELARRAGGRVDQAQSTDLVAILSEHVAPLSIGYLSLALGGSAAEEAALIPLLLAARHRMRAITLSAQPSPKLRDRLQRHGYFWVETVRFGDDGQLWVDASLRAARVRQPQLEVKMGVSSGRR